MSKKMIDFIDRSPTAFHAVKNVSDMLKENGFSELYEFEKWDLQIGGKYFVRKNGSSIIAFEYRGEDAPFMICASHSDFPAFKVKESVESVYTLLTTERYGGMLMYSWFDRPLSIAGRVALKTADGIETRLVNVDRDLLVIPSVAIHMQRNANDGFSPNPAVDLRPLMSVSKGSKLDSLIASELSVSEDDIISHDLFLYAREKGKAVGAEGDLIVSPRLDNLECVFLSLEAFINAKNAKATKVYAVFDNEEVGSSTKSGANSTFLSDVLLRCSLENERYIRNLQNSFMVSADNAHAKHPNHPELSDSNNAPLLGGGVVIKYNANQRYTTDALSSAVFSQICTGAGVKTQSYFNRADIPGGSTLGSISNTRVSVNTVDIGLPQLAMHSAVETAALADAAEMERALGAFYSTSLCFDGENIKILK